MLRMSFVSICMLESVYMYVHGTHKLLFNVTIQTSLQNARSELCGQHIEEKISENKRFECLHMYMFNKTIS